MYFTESLSIAQLRIAVLVCLSLVMAPLTTTAAQTNSPELQICDPTADYFLGLEDYVNAVRSHEALLKSDPNNALAHYHLGFAYGMINRPDAELHEYLRAVDLGLTSWDLFLNLGLVYLDNGNIESAIGAFHLATVFGPTRPETHFNLALAYERAGMLAKAEHETLVSIRLDSKQADAWNTLAVLYAEQGDRGRAGKLWCDLVHTFPDYIPARSNLRLLEQIDQPASPAPASSGSSAALESPSRQTATDPNESGFSGGCDFQFGRDGQYPSDIGATDAFAQGNSTK
jgi:tetratricopeptide (TPR) repeat protein